MPVSATPRGLLNWAVALAEGPDDPIVLSSLLRRSGRQRGAWEPSNNPSILSRKVLENSFLLLCSPSLPLPSDLGAVLWEF